VRSKGGVSVFPVKVNFIKKIFFFGFLFFVWKEDAGLVHNILRDRSAARATATARVADVGPSVLIVLPLLGCSKEGWEIGGDRVARVICPLKADGNPPLARRVVPDGSHDTARGELKVCLSLHVVAGGGVGERVDGRRGHVVCVSLIKGIVVQA
jgi:hypothetical protein